MKNRALAVILCAAMGIIACLSVAADAQGGDRHEGADSYQLKEVVVTATRSEKAADAVSADVDILNNLLLRKVKVLLTDWEIAHGRKEL